MIIFLGIHFLTVVNEDDYFSIVYTKVSKQQDHNCHLFGGNRVSYYKFQTIEISDVTLNKKSRTFKHNLSHEKLKRPKNKRARKRPFQPLSVIF